MAKQTINIGASPNDGTGTPLRTAFDYTNQNFTELYTATGPSGNNIVVPGTATITGDLTVRTNKLFVNATGVGVGTTSVFGDFTIQNSSNCRFEVTSSAGGTSIENLNNARNAYLNMTMYADAYIWNRLGTTAMTLNTSGLGVGIAPTSFGAGYGTIQVSGATGSGIRMGSPTNGSFIYSDNTWLNILTETNIPHRHFVNNQIQYTVQHPGIFTWLDGAGGTRMTLNSTGLGVGASPSTKLDVLGSGDGELRVRAASDAALIFSETTANKNWKLKPSGGDFYFQYSATAYNSGYSSMLTLTSTGNVGVGVTPSAWGSFFKSIESGAPSAYVIAAANVNGVQLSSNCYNDNTNWLYKTTGTAARFAVNTSQFQWFIAPSGTAGNAITFTQAMTLDASGRLLVGTTSAFTDLTGSKEVKVGDGGMQTLTIASFPATTATNVARGGLGGLVYVGAYNGTGQYGAIVLWTASSATVVSVINGTGSTITFGVSGGFLQMTSSLALTQVNTNSLRI